MYHPEGMKARVSSVQSIEPHRILTPTRDSNYEPPDPESRVVTTILPLPPWRRGRSHDRDFRCSTSGSLLALQYGLIPLDSFLYVTP